MVSTRLAASCPQAALLPLPAALYRPARRDTSTAACSTSAASSCRASQAASTWAPLPSPAPHMTRSAAQRVPRLNVLCMAHPRRVAKVTSQIQRELGDMLVNDAVVLNALSPERAQGEDMQLSVVPSITHVYVSNDLQVVKAYISIYSDDYGKKRAMANLKRLEPYVRKQMGQRVPLRLTPEYRFAYDDTLDEMELVQKVIGEEDVARYKRELAEEFGEDEVEEEIEGAAGLGLEGDDAAEEDDGFFGADEVGEQEYQEISSTDVFDRPGPFDDLFTGDGDQLVQSRTKAMPPPEKKGKGGGKKKGARNSAGVA